MTKRHLGLLFIFLACCGQSCDDLTREQCTNYVADPGNTDPCNLHGVRINLVVRNGVALCECPGKEPVKVMESK